MDLNIFASIKRYSRGMAHAQVALLHVRRSPSLHGRPSSFSLRLYPSA